MTASLLRRIQHPGDLCAAFADILSAQRKYFKTFGFEESLHMCPDKTVSTDNCYLLHKTCPSLANPIFEYFLPELD